MSITSNEAELEIIQIELPNPHRTTLRRRAVRLEQLAMLWLAYGPAGVTEHSAMVAAQRCYIAELGRWVRNCKHCRRAFTTVRDDTKYCGSTCRKSASRKRKG